MTEPAVIAFLSSGRCGTRWLAQQLARSYPDAEVEHEPIGALYKPRLYFRRYRDPDAILEVPEVARHIRRIETARRCYVETGWPLLAALPLLAERLGERLRIVHLTRDPVASALAHLAGARYAGSPRRDRYTRWATLSPEDRNVFQPRYAEVWDRLTPLEKCLYWWTEIHMLGLELPGRLPPVPFLRIQSERLLGGDRDATSQLLQFIGVPVQRRWAEPAAGEGSRQDGAARPRVRDGWGDPLHIHRHPATLAVARALGYELGALDRSALLERYVGSHAGRGAIVNDP